MLCRESTDTAHSRLPLPRPAAAAQRWRAAVQRVEAAWAETLVAAGDAVGEVAAGAAGAMMTESEAKGEDCAVAAG